MKKLFYFSLLYLLISFNTDLKAQPPDPGGGQGDPPGVPIDGGISLLLAAGVAYGGKKVYEMNQKDEDSNA